MNWNRKHLLDLQALEAGETDPDRVESFRRLLAAREGAVDW